MKITTAIAAEVVAQVAAQDRTDGDGFVRKGLFIRGGRSGAKLHLACEGMSSLMCGRWLKHDVRHFATSTTGLVGMPIDRLCEKCFAGIHAAAATAATVAPVKVDSDRRQTAEEAVVVAADAMAAQAERLRILAETIRGSVRNLRDPHGTASQMQAAAATLREVMPTVR